MAQFHVTYDVVTPESAEECDVAEAGFVDSHGRRVELEPEVCGDAAGKIKDACGMTLRQALNYVSGCFDRGGGPSFYEADVRIDYHTGAEERRALHVSDSVTAASLARITRLLRA